MAGASRDSLAQVKTEAEQALSTGGVELSQQLFAALAVIDDNGSLRRSLTDPTWDPAKRRALVAQVFGAHVSDATRQVLEAAVAARWSHERDLGDALEHLAVLAAAGAAERGGLDGLKNLAAELLGFRTAVESSHDVQRALTEQQAPTTARGDLAVRLLPSSATPEAQLLVRQATEHARGAKPVDLVRRFADVVSDRQRRWIADVTVARPLDNAQLERLERGLSSAFGRDLTLNVNVDPELVGGIRVQVGDDVVDSSIATRLNDLQRKMAG